jgi:hypothetical protein
MPPRIHDVRLDRCDGYFEMKMGDIFPARRRDPEFLRLLIDTLKVERPAYRGLYTSMAAHDWPTAS